MRSEYLESKLADLRRLGVHVRRVTSPDAQRPMAVSDEMVYVGGDTPLAFSRGLASLTRVRSLVRAEADRDDYRAERLAQQLRTAEVGWDIA